MRGTDGMQESLFMMSKLEDFVPADHPLRPIRLLVNEALERLNGLFNEIYADTERAGIAPEKLMRALLLQVFYSIRSKRQPRGFAIDSKGKYLVASGEKSDTISVYAIDPASGALRLLNKYPTGKASNWVEIVSFD